MPAVHIQCWNDQLEPSCDLAAESCWQILRNLPNDPAELAAIREHIVETRVKMKTAAMDYADGSEAWMEAGKIEGILVLTLKRVDNKIERRTMQ